MGYENFTTEEFIGDQDFVRWVKNPTAELDLFWADWLTRNPEQKQKVATARNIILSVQYKNQYQPNAGDMQAVWSKIQAADTDSQLASDTSRQLWPVLFRSAAALVLISVAALTSWRYLNPTKIPTGQVAAKLIEVKTARGKKDLLVLPDGSRITLNADSRITYQSDFGSTHRDLTLEGEAFFEVQPDKTKPFHIQTGNLTTTVVGTSFNINAHKADPQIKVAVSTGIVEVAADRQTPQESMVRLRPSQMTIFSKAQKELTVRSFDPDLELAWTNDRIALKNADFAQIKLVLERRYDVTFVVDKGLEVKEEFNATFENVSIDKILDALNYTSEFHYKLVKDKVFVTRKNAK